MHEVYMQKGKYDMTWKTRYMHNEQMTSLFHDSHHNVQCFQNGSSKYINKTWSFPRLLGSIMHSQLALGGITLLYWKRMPNLTLKLINKFFLIVDEFSPWGHLGKAFNKISFHISCSHLFQVWPVTVHIPPHMGL